MSIIAFVEIHVNYKGRSVIYFLVVLLERIAAGDVIGLIEYPVENTSVNGHTRILPLTFHNNVIIEDLSIQLPLRYMFNVR